MPEIAERPATKKTAGKPPTLGSLADKIWQLKEDKKVADKAIKAIEVEISGVEAEIFEMLDAQDTRKAEGKKASISINSSIQANTEDWPTFMDFVAAGKRGDKKAYLHLVQRRVSVEAYRELLELGVKVPGLVPFTKRSLSVTTLPS